ncbi:HAD family hydrolase [Hoyosella subflava]|uniref:Beta-phosphoglucomutase n=1 Tax=Hoyosella subflava (strain DSM 45089 / JCM 17490 / NBRC 109087 / DQS3-9A1) TaxID=443218 RepID=F6EJ14_HOYSD|nr:beta-phosphoglucomutase family hydrolase [Hoyosella subflava]AEF41246.1 Beta-phosphoglucomutase family hydrolase [Hoyosella subflava DQS3-9A1]
MHLLEAEAVLFDLDGVLTDTAAVHERAWAQVMSEFLDSYGGVEPYSVADYYTHLDGKQRQKGIQSLLASRGIDLPAESVTELGARKNAAFRQALSAEGVQVFPGSVRFLDWIQQHGIPVAVVSSSRNAPAVLEAAGLLDRFVTVVDGTVAAEHDLPSKPAPDTYEYGAKLLGAAPERTAIIEDAVSGVAAGRAGNFWVVGVDRGAGSETLQQHGADIVVGDLGELVEA